MRRRLTIFGIVVGLPLLFVGGVAAQDPTGFWMFCDGVPLACDEQAPPTTTVITTAPGSTVTVTVPGTTTAPTTTAPPTTTEPPPPVGTTINTTTRWICRQALSLYGPLPITVNSTVTNAHALTLNNGLVRLETGCRGDANPVTIDLIVHINGNGRNMGSDDDALVVAGATDIQLTGYGECGFLGPGSHQDFFRFNQGARITLIGVTSGNWDTLFPTCHGAGGNVYMDNVFQSAAGSADAVCVRCKIVASKTYDPNAGPAGVGLGIGWSTRSGARDSCFAGRHPITIYASTTHPGFINVNNLAIDTDSSAPQPLPSACQA